MQCEVMGCTPVTRAYRMNQEVLASSVIVSVLGTNAGIADSFVVSAVITCAVFLFMIRWADIWDAHFVEDKQV